MSVEQDDGGLPSLPDPPTSIRVFADLAEMASSVSALRSVWEGLVEQGVSIVVERERLDTRDASGKNFLRHLKLVESIKRQAAAELGQHSQAVLSATGRRKPPANKMSTERERQIVHALAAGDESRRSIARRLGVSLTAVQRVERDWQASRGS